MIKLAINGYGRIGRSVLRALYESKLREHMQVVAINELADLATIAHLTQYDSTHGRFQFSVDAQQGLHEALLIDGDEIIVSHCADLCDIKWPNVDVVLECSGHYDRFTDVQAHLKHGANKVLLSQPGQAEITAIVRGINEQELDSSLHIASAASCTTNAITPVIKVLDDAFGIAHGCITTIHSAMNDQPVLDAYHNTDLRKTRAAGSSMIPVETGLAAGIGRILPHLNGLFTAKAVRIPTQNVSAMELTAQVSGPVSLEAVNNALQAAAETEFKGLLGYSIAPLASCDFNHDPRSGIVDAAHTRVSGQLVNIFTWFDNEWAYANRMLELAMLWSDKALPAQN